MPRPPYFPAFLDLHGRACVVVGGGHIARDKIAGLLEAAADVTVIAPQAEPRVAALARTGALRWNRRAYRDGDLDGAFLVIAATAEPQVNRQVWAEAHARGCLVNVVDVPELCDYITPSIVRRGKLTIAVSTQGAAPAFAAVMRRYLERLLGDEIGEFLERAVLWRGQLNRARLTPREKRRWWYALLGRAAPLLLNASPRRGPPHLPAEVAGVAGAHPTGPRNETATSSGRVDQLCLLGLDPAPAGRYLLAAVQARLADGNAVAAQLAAVRAADGRRVFDGFLILACGSHRPTRCSEPVPGPAGGSCGTGPRCRRAARSSSGPRCRRAAPGSSGPGRLRCAQIGAGAAHGRTGSASALCPGGAPGRQLRRGG